MTEAKVPEFRDLPMQFPKVDEALQMRRTRPVDADERVNVGSDGMVAGMSRRTAVQVLDQRAQTGSIDYGNIDAREGDGCSLQEQVSAEVAGILQSFDRDGSFPNSLSSKKMGGCSVLIACDRAEMPLREEGGLVITRVGKTQDGNDLYRLDYFDGDYGVDDVGDLVVKYNYAGNEGSEQPRANSKIPRKFVVRAEAHRGGDVYHNGAEGYDWSGNKIVREPVERDRGTGGDDKLRIIY